MPPYVTRHELEITLGRQTFLALFEENNSAEADEEAVDLVLERATARVNGYLEKVYQGELPFATPPPLAKEAALQFAVGMAYLRNPEYARHFGEAMKVREFEEAKKLCEALMENRMRLGPTPTIPDPANVAGGVYFAADDATAQGVGGGFWKNGFGDY